MSIFDYEHPERPKDCTYLISPSMISKFFDYPKSWYDEEYLGTEKSFHGNTSTVIGTICHHIYECVSLGKPVSRDEINNDLIQYMQEHPNPDVDITEVMDGYPKVAKEVVNTYLIPLGKLNNVKCEFPVVAKVDKGIYVGGTCDRLEGDIVCDYKTVNKMPNKIAIPFGYKIQLLSYAYGLKQQGVDVNYIRIIYGVKPTKTIDARCVVVTEQVDDTMWTLIDDTLKLIAETIHTVREHPEMAYLLFKSYEIKRRRT